MTFQELIFQGIPDELPIPQPFDSHLNHAPQTQRYPISF
jgi:urocanate hydratase